jgi:hypothetical protein
MTKVSAQQPLLTFCKYEKDPDIFLDDCDRNNFLGQLEKNLSLTGLQVLLIRTSNRPPWGSDAESVCIGKLD